MKLPDFYSEEIAMQPEQPVQAPETNVNYDPEMPEWYTPEPTAEKHREAIQDIISSFPGDRQEEENNRIQASLFLADRLQLKPSAVYRNFDTVARQFWQKTTSPTDAWNAIKRAWDIGWKEYELGQLSYRKMMGEDVDEEIDELKKSMPAEDQKKRALPASLLKSFSRMAPITIAGMRQGAAEGLVAGGTAAGVAAIAGQLGPQAVAPEEIVTVPGAFLGWFTAGAAKGAMQNIGQVEAGLAYDEMRGLDIPESIATAAASGVGIVNATLETMQIGKIPGVDELLNKAFRTGVRNVMKGGALRSAAKNFAKKYATNIPEQVAQELAQESTNILATETAKEFTNLAEKHDIPRATTEEVNQRLINTAIESAKSFTVMGLPGAIASSVNVAQNTESIQQAMQNTQYVTVEEDIWNKLAEAEGNDLEDLVQAINEKTGEEQRNETKVELHESQVDITEGTEKKKLDYTIDDDAVTITGMDDLSAYAARQAMAKIQNEYPDRVIQWAGDLENTEQLRRAVEDLDPNVRVLNFELDRFNERIDSLKADMDTQQAEIATKQDDLAREKQDQQVEEDAAATEAELQAMREEVENIKSSIEVAEQKRDELQTAKDQYNPLEYREPWRMTSGEFRRHLQGRAEMQEDAASSAQGMSLKAEISRTVPSLSDEEAEAGVRLVEALAAAQGEDVAEYMGRTFRFATPEEQQKVAQKAQKRGVPWSGAHQIGEDGRSIIAASQSADFSTFIHEMGHVLRRNLTAEQEAVAGDWAGAVKSEDGTYLWNEQAEENFADGFVEYLRSGQAPRQELQTVLQRIADFLREIVNRVFRDVDLTPEVRGVMDELLGAEVPKQDVLFQKKMQDLSERNMVVFHNVTADKIEQIDSVGGLPMPSLAVTRKDIPFTQFGNTTLIGTNKLFNEVYNRDVWSPTVPAPEYSIDQKKMNQLEAELREGKKYVSSNRSTTIENASNAEIEKGPREFAEWLRRSLAVRAAYLIDQGTEIPFIEKKPDAPIEGAEITDDMVELFQNREKAKIEEVENPAYDPNGVGRIRRADILYRVYDLNGELYTEAPTLQEAEKSAQQIELKNPELDEELSRLVWESILENLKKSPRIMEEFKEEGPSSMPRYFNNEGELNYIYREDFKRQIQKVIDGQKEPDYKAMETFIEKNTTEEATQKWIREKLNHAYSDPFVKVGNQKKPYTAENLLDYMDQQGRVATQESFMGIPNLGKIASIATKELKSEEEIKADSENLRTQEEVNEYMEEKVKPLDEKFRDLAQEKYTYDDTWEANTDARKALFEYIKAGYKKRSESRMAKKLRKYDFDVEEGDPIIEVGLDLIDALVQVPTDYYEAKPDRVVRLDEFRAIVLPMDDESSARDIAQKHGLDIVEYDRGEKQDRIDKTRKYLEEHNNLLFQVGPVYHGTPHNFDQFTTEKMGTGEGAQAFGWGLYFTDKEQIARYYADTLTRGKNTYSSLDEYINTIKIGEKTLTEYGINGYDAKPLLDDDTQPGKYKLKKKDELLKIVEEESRKWEALSKDEDYSFRDLAKEKAEAFQNIKRDIDNNKKIFDGKSNRNLYAATIHKGKNPSEYMWLDWYGNIDKEKADKIKEQAKKERVESRSEEETLWDVLRKAHSSLSYYDDIGKAFSNARQLYDTLEAIYRSDKEASLFLFRSGIDGIRYPAGTISGVGEGTNYVVFDENAITIEDHILFQRSPEHEAEVQRAVEAGYPVPDHILREYSDEDWAQEELSRRQQILQKLEDFFWLTQEARGFDNSEEFAEYVQSDFFTFTAQEEHPELYEGGNPTTDWLKQFWQDAQQEEFFIHTSLDEGNQNWLQKVDRNYVRGILEELALRYVGKKGKSFSIHGKFYASAAKYKANKQIKEEDWQQLEKIIRNNPTRYREMLSDLMGDDEELQRFRIEESADRAKGITPADEKVDPRTRVQLANQFKKLRKKQAIIRNGEITAGEIDRLYEETEERLRESERKIKKITQKLEKEQQEARRRAEGAYKVLERQKGEIKNLQQEIRRRDREISKLSDQKQKQKERLKKVRAEKNEKLQQLRKDYQAKLREVKRQEKEKREKAVKDERKRQKEIQKRKKEAQELREYKLKLARIITRSVPKSVHWEYREMIEAIQAGIDPNFRSKRTHELWDKRREFFDQNPDVLNEISPELAKKLWQKSIDQISLEELETLADQVEHMVEVGKTKLRLQEEAKKREANGAAQRIANKLLNGNPLQHKEPVIEHRQSTGEKIQSVYLSTIRPDRLADMLDRGADFKGFAHKIFRDEVNDAYRESLQRRFNREAEINGKLKDLGMTVKDLAGIREVDGIKFSLDQIMDIYAASKNRLKWRAVLYGNRISTATALNAIASLSEKEKQFADAIMDDYEENYHRLRKAHLDYTNEDMGHEENYTPMRRTEGDYTTHKEELAQEILMRKSLRQGSAWRGMTKSRIEIAARHQRPIRLGLYSTWAEQVSKQEHYIASADQILKLNRIMRNDFFKDAVEQQIGKPMLDQLQNYVNRFANPTIYKSTNQFDKMVKKVRNNVALAYLAFNMVTMVKQVPSLAFYMQESSPADLLAGITKAATNWKEVRKFIEDRDPQMRERSIERDMEELKRLQSRGFQKIQKAISEQGMKGIMFFDKMATTAGWIATYDRYKRAGYSDAEATKAARDVTLRTQPQASAKDVADIYARDGILTLFTQFSNQLNQIWNMMTYDMPASIRQHHYFKTLGMFTSFALSGSVIWMLSERRPPDEPEEFAQIMVEQFLNTVPILGPVAARAMDGWTTEVSVFMPAQGAGELASLVRDMAKGKGVSDYRKESVMKSALEGLAVATGMPYVTPRRVVEGWQEDALVETVLFGGKVGEKRED